MDDVLMLIIYIVATIIIVICDVTLIYYLIENLKTCNKYKNKK